MDEALVFLLRNDVRDSFQDLKQGMLDTNVASASNDYEISATNILKACENALIRDVTCCCRSK